MQMEILVAAEALSKEEKSKKFLLFSSLDNKNKELLSLRVKVFEHVMHSFSQVLGGFTQIGSGSSHLSYKLLLISFALTLCANGKLL